MIKVGDIGSEDSLKLPLIEYQQVIETFPSDTAQETFADGIRTWSMDRRAQHFDGASVEESPAGRSRALASRSEPSFPGALRGFDPSWYTLAVGSAGEG